MKRLLAVMILAVLLIGALPAQAAGKARVAAMLAGETQDFSTYFEGYDVNLTSSDLRVASFDDEGVLTANEPGTAILTAEIGGKSANAGLLVFPNALELSVGDSYQLPASGARYAVQDISIAKVGAGSVLMALSEGETLLGARVGGRTFYIAVKVNDTGDAEQSKAAKLSCAATAEKIILVERTEGSNAILSIHEKQDGVWTELYSGRAILGKNGIDKKKEGDGRTPTGTFNLTIPFGIDKDPGAAQEYTKVDKYDYWCGTSGSKYYNRLVDSREVDEKGSASDEHLIRYKGYYDYAMFIDYNAAGEAGKGSCIFLHCAPKGSKSTAGCVAVEKSVMKNIVKWASEGTKIVIMEEPDEEE